MAILHINYYPLVNGKQHELLIADISAKKVQKSIYADIKTAK